MIMMLSKQVAQWVSGEFLAEFPPLCVVFVSVKSSPSS